MRIVIAIIFISIFTSVDCRSQDVEVDQPYYIDFNESNHLINEVNADYLQVKFKDFTGDNKDLILSAYDDKGTLVKSYKLNKDFGENYYTLGISELFNVWPYDVTYRFVMMNSDNQKMTSLIRRVKVPEEVLPTVNIVTKPVNINCKIDGESVVDFYANIESGKAPYQLTWVVYDENKEDLIYNPKHSKLENPGDTEIIRVEADPSYFVFLLVIDACGNEVSQQLLINCDKTTKKRNTLFWNPLLKSKSVEKQ